MNWENTKRGRSKADRRRSWNEQRIADAITPRRKLWAACSWLVSEAWKNGRLDEALDWVLTKVHEIREEEQSHDRYDYAE